MVGLAMPDDNRNSEEFVKINGIVRKVDEIRGQEPMPEFLQLFRDTVALEQDDGLLGPQINTKLQS